jgi:hypothetical protein
MKLKTRTLLAIPCLAAFLAVTGAAHANTISGSVWTNQAVYQPGVPLAEPVGTAAGTFTVDGINFNSSSTATGYTVAGFLTSGGNTVSNQSAGFLAIAGDSMNNTIYELTGTTLLTAGSVYHVIHDDGVYLYLNGGANALPSDSGLPTAADDETFTVATTGDYSFRILYTEVNGAPGVLTAPFASNAAETPEPSSIILLGSGLLGVAGLVRRRMGV